MILVSLIILGALSAEFYMVLQNWEPSLYEVLNVRWNTPSDEIRKRKRDASLKYHPDKLKGEEKLKYADVFINLNNHFDTITIGREMYDYYNIKK